MNFTLIGAGAIGSLFGLKLVKSGHQVHFWTRENTQSLNRHFPDRPSFHFYQNNTEKLNKSDCILLCVKAFSVESVLLNIKPFIEPNTPIILMHNGMGTHQIAQKLLPYSPLLFATTTQASLKINEHEIKHTGEGITTLGALSASAHQYNFFTEVFNQAIPECQWHQNIEQALWHKLAVNCLINPLTTLMQIPNGELLSAVYQDKLMALSHEIANVMEAEGIDCQADQLFEQGMTVAKKTAHNLSSMNQDLAAKRQTEIDFITGHLIRVADKHGIEVPHHLSLYQAIKHQENAYRVKGK